MNFKNLEQKVIQWGVDRGLYDTIDGTSPMAQYAKLKEEFDELGGALACLDRAGVEDAIGDMMVVLTHISKLTGLDLLRCYSTAYTEIKDRKGKMVNGLFVKEK